MKFSQVCINRPVFTVVIALLLILVGIICFLELPVRFQPYYFRPALMVTVSVPGASSDYVENNVTTPLEQSLAGTPGLDIMNSRSQQGTSNIFLNFKNLSPTEFITAQSQVLQEVASTTLPELAQRPQIMQRGDSNIVMQLGISDDHMPPAELTNYVNNYLLPLFNQIPGVAQVQVYADPPALWVRLNPQQMAALNVSINDIQNALNNGNTSYPLGSLYTDTQALELNSQMTIPDIQSFQNLVIAKKGARLIYLKDVADIAVDYDSLDHYYSYVNGKPGVVLEIDQSDQANPIQVGQDARALFKEMKPNLPQGLSIDPVFDLSQPLQGAIDEVYITIGIAIVLVILVTLAFLGNWRATFIPIVTIPVCLIATFGVMLALGFTINIMTLLALVLAVGLVVDDAIVVLENTYRHIENGEPALTAARKSINEISFAVLGITVCLVAVYIPALFLPNNIDTTYFQEFAFSLAGAILISGFIALTLSPMMCSRLLQRHHATRYETKLDHLTQAIHQRYGKSLDWSIRHPKTIFTVLFANLILGGFFFIYLPSDLLPTSELNFVQGNLQGPNSANSAYLNEAVKPFRTALENNPDLKNVFMYVMANNGIFFGAEVKDSRQRESIAESLNNTIKNMPNFSGGVQVVDANSNTSSSHQSSLFFYIRGMASYQEISTAAAQMVTALQNSPMVSMAINNVQFSQQKYNFNVNLNLATMLGVDLNTLNTTLSTFLGGYTFPNSTYQVNGYAYSIIMQLPRALLGDLSILNNLYVTNASNQLIQTSRFITVTPTSDLPTHMHVNQLRAGEVDVIPAPGYSNGEIIQEVQKVAAQVLPQGLEISWGGQGRNLLENASSGDLFIILGLVFIYLVLAALFESFLDPLIILCTVPLCIVAGLIGLKLIGGSINIYTKIALVTLIGLVSKHGVLITQFANQLRAEGHELVDAVKQAALIRLRPILMTTLTMVLGALPLVFAVGTDATGRSQIGMIIVLGLLLGSLFSLFVVPVAYLIMGRFKTKFRF